LDEEGMLNLEQYVKKEREQMRSTGPEREKFLTGLIG